MIGWIGSRRKERKTRKLFWGCGRSGPPEGEPLAAWGQQGALADIKVLPPSRHPNVVMPPVRVSAVCRKVRGARVSQADGLLRAGHTWET